MKIGILTYYGVHNHGALLQANALKKVLNSKGYDCGFLEFERSYSNISSEQTNKYKLGFGSISFYTKYLFEKGVSNILYNVKKKKVLSTFRKQELPLIGSYKEFKNGIVVIGSDEVFSLEIGVNPFLYGNDLENNYVFSYAGCFGPTTYEEVLKQNKGEMIRTGLNGMEAISVRDYNSKKVVKEITGKDATLVCDPVILYGYKDEMDKFVPDLKNYILIYSYDKNLNEKDEYKYIQEYAIKHNLKIVSVGYHHEWCKSINASPIELLGWIKNASLVVTDTFHGSVMSIICNTPMAVKLRGNKNKLEFLLSEYGLKHRTMEAFDKLETVASEDIDFNMVNDVITERRQSSMQFLDGALERCQ